MTTEEILAQLRSPEDGIPREALAEVAARREEFVPILVAELEKVTALGEDANDEDALACFAIYLLAEFREPRAFEPILAWFALDSEESDLFGDVIVEDGASILAAVGQGQFARLAEYGRRPDLSPWVRGAVFETLALQVVRGEESREAVVQYFNELMTSRAFPDEDKVSWTLLVAACLDFHPGECLENIRALYERVGIDEAVVGDFENIKLAADSDREEHVRLLVEDRPPLTNTAEAVAWWGCFPQSEDDEEVPGVTIRNEQPKIGRNDDCPCGSGKKYKKCCMPAGA